ncbi:MAG: hypothetical protein WC655_24840 [Candidatus Hydrogenedentales bacterium]|jgi:hypothetical protein
MPEETQNTEVVAAYKGFDTNLKCKGFQFEVGKTYVHKGSVEICASGFHACENPLDVWNYYRPGESRFASVSVSGQIARHSDYSKVAGASISINAELSMPEIITSAVKFVMGLCAASKETTATTGNWANAATTGYGANAATTGYAANAATTGDWANAATTGCGANAATTGYGANAATTGNWANAATTGNWANAATTGYGANAATTGEKSIAAALGKECRAKAGIDGCIVLRDDSEDRPRVVVGYVGENGIKADTWYEAKAGKLVERAE